MINHGCASTQHERERKYTNTIHIRNPTAIHTTYLCTHMCVFYVLPAQKQGKTGKKTHR